MNRNGSTAIFAVISVCVIAASLTWGIPGPFPHEKHEEVNVDCTACHPEVEKSNKASDNNLPSLESCEMCHEPIPDVKEWAPVQTELNFSHKKHLGKGVECKTCHNLLPEKAMSMPGMSLCLLCHRKEQKPEACVDCHSKLGSRELMPKSHTKQWPLAHGEDARQKEEYCANCHAQSLCQDCHQGDNVKPRPHRRNWVYVHSIAARKGTLECSDCHDAANESRCVSCHKSPVGEPSSHRRGRWIARHGREAEMNLAACATCHFDMAEDALCKNCHKE
ncbi:MAG: cytochrome c3 family protein [bacterium]